MKHDNLLIVYMKHNSQHVYGFFFVRDSSVDIDPSLGHFPSETDIGDIESLHHQQLTLPQFAMTVLEQSLQGLHTLHMDASLELLRLAFEAWKILAVVIRSDIWQSEVKSAHDWVRNYYCSCIVKEWMGVLLEHRIKVKAIK